MKTIYVKSKEPHRPWAWWSYLAWLAVYVPIAVLWAACVLLVVSLAGCAKSPTCDECRTCRDGAEVQYTIGEPRTQDEEPSLEDRVAALEERNRYDDAAPARVECAKRLETLGKAGENLRYASQYECGKPIWGCDRYGQLESEMPACTTWRLR